MHQTCTSVWTPDPVGRLQQLAHNLGGSAGDLTRTYSYNPANQIIGRTGTNTAYDWDEAVAVTRNYTANGLNQYTAAGGVTFGYDARGNLTTSGSDTFGYSSENLLTSGPGVSLAYDPLMRLAEVTGSTTTRFAYDGLDLVAEYNSAGTLTDRYVFGPGVDEPIVWYHGSGTSDRRWLAADERGSIVAVTDDTGVALGIDTYDEYGIPGAGNIGRFQYTGQAWLPELGMYYYKARIYSPTLGRFMQTDPIGYADGLNWYNYVGSDPVNFVDPTGTVHKECVSNPISGTETIDGQVWSYTSAKVCRWVYDASDWSFWAGGDNWPRRGGAYPPGVLLRIPPGRARQAKSQPQETTPQNAKPAPKSRLSCLGSALWENKTGLLLDTAGWVANFALPEGSAAVAIAGSTIGVIGIGAAVVDNKGPVDAGVAGTLAYTGKMGATAEGMLRGAGSALGHRIGFAALAASSAYDVGKTAVDYNQCMSGN